MTEPAVTGRQTAGTGLRARALTAAMSTYTAAHGHPLGLEHAVGAPRVDDRRWLPSRRVAVTAALGLVVLLGLVVVGVGGLPGGEAPAVVLPDAGSATNSAAPERDGGTEGAGVATEGDAQGTDDGAPPVEDHEGRSGPPVVVHVVGEVTAPGLVELPDGARVADAIEAAGGVTPAAVLAGVNLARPVVDGEQVVVPAEGEEVASAVPTVGGGEVGPLDLNSADAEALDGLPGVGPVLAERIVAWREQNGRFSSVDELVEVSGIGPALLADVRDLVRAG